MNALEASSSLNRGLVLFFSAIILAGLLALWLIVGRLMVRDYRVAHVYEKAEATILSVRTEQQSSSSRTGSRTYRRAGTARPVFSFRFDANGKTVTTSGYDSFGGHDATFAEYSRFNVGDRVPCWYDPADPKQAVLVTDWRPKRYWIGLIPGTFIFLAGLFLYGITTPARPKH